MITGNGIREPEKVVKYQEEYQEGKMTLLRQKGVT